jgi:hypothetical protein
LNPWGQADFEKEAPHALLKNLSFWERKEGRFRMFWVVMQDILVGG